MRNGVRAPRARYAKGRRRRSARVNVARRGPDLADRTAMKRLPVLFALALALGACASAPEDEASTVAAAADDGDPPEDVATVSAEGRDARIAKAVLGVTKLRDEKGKKRVFVQVRYYDAGGELVALAFPNAKRDGGAELALVRVEAGTIARGASAALDAGFAEEARALTTRLVRDVKANGCNLPRGIVRAAARFVAGLVVGAVGLAIALVLTPVYLVLLVDQGGDDVDSKFVDITTAPYEAGLRLLIGAFRPCRALPTLED